MSNIITILSGNIKSLMMEFLVPIIIFSSHSSVQTFLFSDAIKMYGRVAVFRKPRRSRTKFRRV